jgi:SAM-dependent methyltransferase
MDAKKGHWERVYETKATDAVSWFQPRAERSLRLIRETGKGLNATILDVGGGASRLVDDLLAEGYQYLSVLDLSAAALAAAQQRLAAQAQRVSWIEADVTQAQIAPQSLDIWHDRAVFHFLTDAADRAAYLKILSAALKPGGFVIIATFAPDGPTQCSGLPVVRYSPEQLQTVFGEDFTRLSHEQETHTTPFGSTQHFVYCCFQFKK